MNGFITYTIVKVVMSMIIMVFLTSFIKTKAKGCGLKIKKGKDMTFLKKCLSVIKFCIFFCIPILSEIGYIIVIFTMMAIWIMDEKGFKEYAEKVKIFEDIEGDVC